MPQYTLVNDRLLSISLSGQEEVFAKKGSMVAYKGKVHFARSLLAGGGVQSLAARTATNEGFQLMSAKGNGEVLYAYYGMFVTIVELRGERFFVESSSVLAFDQRLRTSTHFQGSQGVQGLIRGAATGQGLFTTTLEGNGELAILSEGNAIGLTVTNKNPIFVDPNAYIGHRGELTSNMVTDTNWKTLIGQSSGESFQLKFVGSGTVYIQASER